MLKFSFSDNYQFNEKVVGSDYFIIEQKHNYKLHFPEEKNQLKSVSVLYCLIQLSSITSPKYLKRSSRM